MAKVGNANFNVSTFVVEKIVDFYWNGVYIDQIKLNKIVSSSLGYDIRYNISFLNEPYIVINMEWTLVAYDKWLSIAKFTCNLDNYDQGVSEFKSSDFSFSLNKSQLLYPDYNTGFYGQLNILLQSYAP